MSRTRVASDPALTHDRGNPRHPSQPRTTEVLRDGLFITYGEVRWSYDKCHT